LNPAPAAEQNEKLIWEKELLGLYVSEHPYNVFRPYLTNYAIPLVELNRHKGDDRVIVAGVVSTIKKILTRKGESMLFVKIEDATNGVELLIFPRLLKETPNLWREGQAIITDSKLSEKDREVKVLVNRALPLDPLAPQQSVDAFKKIILEGGPAKKSYSAYKKPSAPTARPTVATPAAPVKPVAKPANPGPLPKPSPDSLRLTFAKDLTAADLNELRQIFSLYPGEHEVYFRVMDSGKARVIKTAFRINNNPTLQEQLKDKFKATIKIAG